MVEELPSSALGTKHHWCKVYEKELGSFQQDGDEGEIWFGEHTTTKLIKWLESSELVHTGSEIIDIGCGNGMTLVELAKRNFTRLTGCDYADQAIQLADEIAKNNNLDITYVVADVLNVESCSSLTDKTFDVCIDKGTYDAVSLNPSEPKQCRELYKDTLCRLLKTNGVFVLASCNWTLDELKEFFTFDFKFLLELPSPKFTFGGSIGNSVTSTIWIKK